VSKLPHGACNRTIAELRAALAAAEATRSLLELDCKKYAARAMAAETKLADERKHALVTLHALAGCVEWMGEDGCDCGSDDPRCALCEAQAIIEKCTVRRAAEAR